MTLVEPFLVARSPSDDKFPEVKEFDFKSDAREMVLKNQDISVQLRCIQLGDSL
jgi:hypothetical protein